MIGPFFWMPLLLSTGMPSGAFCTYYTFVLTAAQLPTPGDAVGFVTVEAMLCGDHTFDGSARMLTSETATAIHIHGPAVAGDPGRILFVLPLPVESSLRIELGPLTPEVEGMFVRQELYMDVHTLEHPDGAFGGPVNVEVAVARGSWSLVKRLYK